MRGSGTGPVSETSAVDFNTHQARTASLSHSSEQQHLAPVDPTSPTISPASVETADRPVYVVCVRACLRASVCLGLPLSFVFCGTFEPCSPSEQQRSDEVDPFEADRQLSLARPSRECIRRPLCPRILCAASRASAACCSATCAEATDATALSDAQRRSATLYWPGGAAPPGLRQRRRGPGVAPSSKAAKAHMYATPFVKLRTFIGKGRTADASVSAHYATAVHVGAFVLALACLVFLHQPCMITHNTPPMSTWH